MKFLVKLEIPNAPTINLELDDIHSPQTVQKFLEELPFSVELNIWGDEIYTESTPISEDEENAKPLVDLYDVAYWPSGKAICLFYGHTPIGNADEIKPYSPVNIIGKIIEPDKSVLTLAAGSIGRFSKS